MMTHRGLLLAVVTGWLGSVATGQVVFRHTFEKGLEATTARGAATPVEVIGEPTVTAGRAGGKALLLRNGLDAVGFATAGHFNPKGGALALWVRPGENWGFTDGGKPVFGGSQVLFHTGGVEGVRRRLVMQTYWRFPSVGFFTYTDNQLTGGWADGVFHNLLFHPDADDWKPREENVRTWNHFLYTWRSGAVDIYANGERLKRTERPDLTFAGLGEVFYLGWKKGAGPAFDPSDPMCITKGLITFDPGFVKTATEQMDTPWETLLADVTIYGQYLNEAQAQRVYSEASGKQVGGPISQRSVLLYAPFDQGLDAALAGGDAAPKALGGPRVAEGKVGGALAVEAGTSAVAYPLPGNLRVNKGTIAFWLAADDWDVRDPIDQVLLSTDGAHRIRIQTNPKARSALELNWERSAGGRVAEKGGVAIPTITHETLIEGVDRVMPGKWFHMAYTWEAGRLTAYRNGVQVAQTSYPVFREKQSAELGGLLVVGESPGLRQPGPPTGYRSRIDELVVLDRALSAAQVSRLVSKGLRDFVAGEATDVEIADLRVKPLPTRSLIAFEAFHSPFPEETRLEVTLSPVDQPSRLFTAALTADGITSTGSMPTAGMAPGRYAVQFRALEPGSGKVLAQNEEGQTCELAPREAWWDNRIGLDEIVPPPWTPMAQRADAVSCWGREIRFEGGPLPAQIVSAGDELLAAPMALRLAVGGRPIELPVGEVAYPKVAEHEVVRRWRGQAAGLDVAVTTTTEFDGMMWVELTVDNPAGPPVTGLALEMPRTARNARFINTTSRGWHGETPQKDLTTDVAWRAPFGGFNHLFWVGGFERGMQWFAEGREGWFNRDRSDEIYIGPAGDHVMTRVKMIDSATDRKRFTIRFGLHPTPIKPAIARSKRMGPLGCWSVVPTLPRPSTASGQSEQEFWAYGRSRRAQDPTFFRYSFINSVASFYGDGEQVRERAWYKSEWENVPGYERMEPLDWSWFQTCPDTSYSDWKVWFIQNRWVHPDYGHLAGIYFDHGAPTYCVNPLHEGRCGFPDEDGVMQPHYKIMAMRRMLKRVYFAVKGIDRDHPQGRTPDQVVTMNTTTELRAPHLSFVFNCDGETMKPAPSGSMMDRLTVPFMASSWSHTAWGWDERGVFVNPNVLFTQSPFESFMKDDTTRIRWVRDGVKPDRFEEFTAFLVSREREYNAMMHLFDHSPMFHGHNWNYTLSADRWNRAVQAFGFYEDDVVFDGIWKTADLIKGQDEQVLAAAYRRPAHGKALLALVNRRHEPDGRNFTVDLAALGLRGRVRAEDAETGDAIAITEAAAGRATLAPGLGARDYRLVLLRGGGG